MGETQATLRIIKFIMLLYGTVSFSVIAYGIYSIFMKKSHIYRDADSSYGLASHRTIAHDSVEINGESAAALGWVYIFLGIIMFVPLIWAFLRL